MLRRLMVLLSVAAIAFSAYAEDAANRGINDSVVSTLVGGNIGDGATDAKKVPLGNSGNGLRDIVQDSSGNFYYNDGNRIMKQTPAGALSVYAGSTQSGFAGDTGLAKNATFNDPRFLAIDAQNNLYVYDFGNARIRKITAADGKINTVVGNGDGIGDLISDVGRPALQVRLSDSINFYFHGIAVNAAGDIFIAYRQIATIFKVDHTTGIFSIFAGNGQSSAVQLQNADFGPGLPLGSIILGLAVLPTGDVIYSDDYCIRALRIATGKNEVIAGAVSTDTPANGVQNTSFTMPDDGTQDALVTAAGTPNGGLGRPRRLAVDKADGSIVFWDSNSYQFRSFTIGGKIKTVLGALDVGSINSGFRGDGGLAVTNTNTSTDDDPRIDRSTTAGHTVAGGVVTFVDNNNQKIRQFTIGGNLTTIAGSYLPIRSNNLGDTYYDFSDDVPMPGLGAPIGSPYRLTADSSNNIYFGARDVYGSSKLYKYTDADKNLSVLAGRVIKNGYPVPVGDGAQATNVGIAGFSTQMAIAADGSIYFSEVNYNSGGNNSVIRKIDPTGKLTTVAGIYGVSFPGDPDGDPSLTVSGTTRNGKQATKVAIQNCTGVMLNGTDLYLTEANGVSNMSKIDLNTGLFSQVNTVNGAVNNNPCFTTIRTSDSSILVAGYGQSGVKQIDNTGAVTTPITLATGCLGMVQGTSKLFFALQNGNIDVYDLATLAYSYSINSASGGTFSGMVANGLEITLTKTDDGVYRFTDNGTNNPVVSRIATAYFNTNEGGGPSVNALDIRQFAPLVLSGSDLIVGVDGSRQMFKIVLGATPPTTSVATVIAGTEYGYNVNGVVATASDPISPGGISVGPDGLVYFTDEDSTIQRIKADGTREVFAGVLGHYGFTPDGTTRQNMLFNEPVGIAISPAGEIYVGDKNYVVRKIAADGTSAVVAGTPNVYGYGGDGLPGTQSLLSDNIQSLALAKNGDLFICDDYNYALRVLSADGILTTYAGGQYNGLDPNYSEVDSDLIELYEVSAVAVDAGGKVYTAQDSYHVITRHGNGKTVVVAGDTYNSGFNGDGRSGPQTLFGQYIYSLAATADGRLVLADYNNNRIRAISNLVETSSTGPIASFTVNPGKQGTVPYKATFESTSKDADGDITSWRWDFGDGSKAIGATAEHTFTKMGSYNVKLTVTDTQGNTSTTQKTVFAALPLITSSTNGKGSFKLVFGPKGANKDSFSITSTHVPGLTNQAGKSAVITIGSFQTTGTVAGKGVKSTSKTVKLAIDPVKQTVSLSLKGVELDAAFVELGVYNENTVGGKTGKPVLIPVVIDVNNGALLLGDFFLFNVVTKFNSGSTGKYAQ